MKRGYVVLFCSAKSKPSVFNKVCLRNTDLLTLHIDCFIC